MKVNVNVIREENIDISITDIEAFKILCKTLNMEFIFDDTLDLSLMNISDSNEVIIYDNKENKIYDDRGELYYRLCMLAKFIFMNFDCNLNGF